MYERAEVKVVTGLAEGVFMSSGAQEEVGQCPRGFRDSSYGREQCQACAVSKATVFKKDEIPSTWFEERGKTDHSMNKDDFFNAGGCPNNIPSKPGYEK